MMGKRQKERGMEGGGGQRIHVKLHQAQKHTNPSNISQATEMKTLYIHQVCKLPHKRRSILLTSLSKKEEAAKAKDQP